MSERTGKIHAASVAKSSRLRRVLDLLRSRRSQGATTREIVVGADVCAVNAAVAELRQNGYEIECKKEGRHFRYRLVENGQPELL